MDYSSFTDAELSAELEAMQKAVNAPSGSPFDGSEARFIQKIAAVKKEMEKRNA